MCKLTSIFTLLQNLFHQNSKNHKIFEVNNDVKDVKTNLVTKDFALPRKTRTFAANFFSK